MIKNLVILTTAITRGNLHQESIGKFYNNVDKIFNYNLIHIINIDHPVKLREKYNVVETQKLFQKIIPEKVKLIFITEKDDNPSFAKAYIKVLKSVHKNNLFNNETIFWWLEDDWKIIYNFNFIPLLEFLNIENDSNSNVAMSITNNTSLCSLRGGPIMSSNFFKNFFDLSKRYIDNFDPELKINRFIRYNRGIPIYKKDIYIICLYVLKHKNYPLTMSESCYWNYPRKYKPITKFQPGKEIKFIIAVINDTTSKNIYYKISNNVTNLLIQNKEQLKLMNLVSFNSFKKVMKNAIINYITIVPHILEDIGRKFNKENDLISPKQEIK